MPASLALYCRKEINIRGGHAMTEKAQLIETILVATDFSPTAEVGLSWALGLGKLHGARLHLVHGLLLPNQMNMNVSAQALIDSLVKTRHP